jgi:hypothetical protein
MKLIKIERRSHDYQAYVEQERQRSGSGNTPYEAVGDLLAGHHEFFDIAIEWPARGGPTTPNQPAQERQEPSK